MQNEAVHLLSYASGVAGVRCKAHVNLKPGEVFSVPPRQLGRLQMTPPQLHRRGIEVSGMIISRVDAVSSGGIQNLWFGLLQDLCMHGRPCACSSYIWLGRHFWGKRCSCSSTDVRLFRSRDDAASVFLACRSRVCISSSSFPRIQHIGTGTALWHSAKIIDTSARPSHTRRIAYANASAQFCPHSPDDTFSVATSPTRYLHHCCFASGSSSHAIRLVDEMPNA